MEPSLVCQAFFGLLTAGGIIGLVIPPLRKNMIDYGTRAQCPTTTSPRTPQTSLGAQIEYLASFKVPHAWFVHYYAVSVACSLFWGWQISRQGKVIEAIAHYSTEGASTAMTTNQIFLTWLLMALQGARRLGEDVKLARPSQSTMWVGIWALGIAYYIAMGISVWIEGLPTLKAHKSSLDGIDVSLPSLKTCIGMALFVVGSALQHECHVYLASLKKYTLPQHPLFRKAVCPHYASECVIYLALTLIAAPKNRILNKTLAVGLGFVIVNLAAAADSSRKWYAQKFGTELLQNRWRMVPYVW